MAQLIIKQGDSEVKRFNLTKDTTTLGRSSTHDVFLPDTKVSREDYVKIIALEDGEYEIYDSGSTNPIMVNGRITSRHRLKDGDEIRLGDTLLIFKSEILCPDVEFLPPENMSEEEMEVVSLYAQKTEFFSIDEIKTKDLISLQQAHQR